MQRLIFFHSESLQQCSRSAASAITRVQAQNLERYDVSFQSEACIAGYTRCAFPFDKTHNQTTTINISEHRRLAHVCESLSSAQHSNQTVCRQGQHVMTHQQIRHASTLPKAGVPKPRPGMEQFMSTPQGGHIARLMQTSETLVELETVMKRNQDQLKPLHLAVAATQLERLFKQNQHGPLDLRVKSIASMVEQGAVSSAPRLAVVHMASILAGLTGCSHVMSPPSLTALAAALISDNCRQLRLSSDSQWRQIVWAFSIQGYQNPAFWHQISGAAVPLVPGWKPGKVASMFKNMAMAGVRRDDFTVACLKQMTGQIQDLREAQLIEALYATASLAPGSLKNVDLSALEQAILQHQKTHENSSETTGTQQVINQAHTTSSVSEAASGASTSNTQDQQTPNTTSADDSPAHNKVSPTVKDAATGFVQSATKQLLGMLPQSDCKSMALYLYIMNKLGMKSSVIVQHVASQFKASAMHRRKSGQSLHPMQVFKLIWACKVMGYQDAQLAVDAVHLCEQRLSDVGDDLVLDLLAVAREYVPKAQRSQEYEAVLKLLASRCASAEDE